MKLGEFLKLLHISSTPIKVCSGYNGKLLCKKYPTGGKADLLEREVVSFRPEIYSKDGMAWASMLIYVDGMEELTHTINTMSETKPCANCEHRYWHDPECNDCDKRNNYRYYQAMDKVCPCQ